MGHVDGVELHVSEGLSTPCITQLGNVNGQFLWNKIAASPSVCIINCVSCELAEFYM